MIDVNGARGAKEAIPGEDEMIALAEDALRGRRGGEAAKNTAKRKTVTRAACTPASL